MPAATPASARWASLPVRGSREHSGAPLQPAATQGHGFSAGPDPGIGHSGGSGRLDAGISSAHAGAYPAHGGPTGFLAAAQRRPTIYHTATGAPEPCTDTPKNPSCATQGGSQARSAFGQSTYPLPAFGAEYAGYTRSPIHHVPGTRSGDTGRCRTGSARSTSIRSRPSIPAYAHNPAPEYPQSARWEGEEGTVLLRVLVNVSGLPEKITVARSSGYTSLDRAAEQAVQHWRFIPGTRDGRPVAMQVEVPIRFRLTDANP